MALAAVARLVGRWPLHREVGWSPGRGCIPSVTYLSAPLLERVCWVTSSRTPSSFPLPSFTVKVTSTKVLCGGSGASCRQERPRFQGQLLFLISLIRILLPASLRLTGFLCLRLCRPIPPARPHLYKTSGGFFTGRQGGYDYPLCCDLNDRCPGTKHSLTLRAAMGLVAGPCAHAVCAVRGGLESRQPTVLHTKAHSNWDAAVLLGGCWDLTFRSV